MPLPLSRPACSRSFCQAACRVEIRSILPWKDEGRVFSDLLSSLLLLSEHFPVYSSNCFAHTLGVLSFVGIHLFSIVDRNLHEDLSCSSIGWRVHHASLSLFSSVSGVKASRPSISKSFSCCASSCSTNLLVESMFSPSRCNIRGTCVLKDMFSAD